MNTCPKCGADRTWTELYSTGRYSRFSCGTTESPISSTSIFESERCLRRQLAAVIAERDQWKKQYTDESAICIARGKEIERLREACGYYDQALTICQEALKEQP
jgi:hypothetical protein